MEDHPIDSLAERLTNEFDDLPLTTIVRAMADCLNDYPKADLYFLHQASHSRLSAERRRH